MPDVAHPRAARPMPLPPPHHPDADSTLLARLDTLEATLTAFIAEARAHWAGEAQRFGLIDQFVDPAINLNGTLAQLIDAFHGMREAAQGAPPGRRADGR